MSDVTVSIKMSPKKAGAMYMQLMKAEDRIEKLEAALKDILNDCINFDGSELTDRIMAEASRVLAENGK